MRFWIEMYRYMYGIYNFNKYFQITFQHYDNNVL